MSNLSHGIPPLLVRKGEKQNRPIKTDHSSSFPTISHHFSHVSSISLRESILFSFLFSQFLPIQKGYNGYVMEPWRRKLVLVIQNCKLQTAELICGNFLDKTPISLYLFIKLYIILIFLESLFRICVEMNHFEHVLSV